MGAPRETMFGTAGDEALRTRHAIPGVYRVHGHAIVSADDFITLAGDRVSSQLYNEADWRHFQAALDVAAVTILDRARHRAHPNYARRNRLIVDPGVDALEQAGDVWHWNPTAVGLADALRAAAPGGGTVAVPGGQAVYDFFQVLGWHAFDLARAETVRLTDGTKLFSSLSPDLNADEVLGRGGLLADPAEYIDPAAQVTLTRWRR